MLLRWTGFVCILFLGHVSSQDFDCDENETPVECVDQCNTCRPTCTNSYCQPGCDCAPGHVRGQSGQCMPREQCESESSDERSDEYPEYGEETPEEQEADRGVCPNVALCRRSCERQGKSGGTCVGKGNRECQCDARPPPGGGSDGCPSMQKKCGTKCRSQGFRDGLCTGPGKRKCSCVGKMANDEEEIGQPETGSPDDADRFGCHPDVCRRHCREQGKLGVCRGTREPKKCVCELVNDEEQGWPPVKEEDIGRRCDNNDQCVNHCRENGFSSGFCHGIAKTCRCLRSSDESVPEQPVEQPEELEADRGICPNVELCRRSCVRQGKSGGVCVGKRCECDAKPPGGGSDGCPAVKRCAAKCRSNGFKDGVCIGPRKLKCRCVAKTANDEGESVLPEKDLSVPEEEADSGVCPDIRRCRHSCVRRGLVGGVCGGPRRFKCRCGRPLPPDRSGECPNVHRCAARCRSRGFRGGFCIGNRQLTCRCVGPRRFDDGEEEQTQMTTAEPAEDTGLCSDVRKCFESCSRQGFRTGKCIGKKCECIGRGHNDGEIMLPTQKPVESIVEEDSGSCPDVRKCFESCNRRGYHAGSCTGKRCNCHGRGHHDGGIELLATHPPPDSGGPLTSHGDAQRGNWPPM